MDVIISGIPYCLNKVVQKPLIVNQFFFHLTFVALASLVGTLSEYANRATIRAFQARISNAALLLETPKSKQPSNVIYLIFLTFVRRR